MTRRNDDYRVRRRVGRGFSWDAVPLGRATDAEIAARFGLHVTTVQQARRRRGIASHQAQQRFIGPIQRKVTRQFEHDWKAQPLGLVPDSWIADALGISRHIVTRQRHRLGLARATVTFWLPCGRCSKSLERDISQHELRISFCSKECRRAGRDVSHALRFAILRRDNFTCQYCGARAPAVPLHVDHVVPVAMGGDASEGNLVTSCQPCNAGKGARVGII